MLNRSWVEEYHVDGFRFDLASCLCRDPQGSPLAAPPLIRELAKDPVLSKVRLSATLLHHCQQLLVARNARARCAQPALTPASAVAPASLQGSAVPTRMQVKVLAV